MAARWKVDLREGMEVLNVETDVSSAAIALQGGQVVSFVPRGDRDWLWLSERARWAPGAALRGGIPVCFPWFGPHPTDPRLPAHGFARTRRWELHQVEDVAGEVQVTMRLASDDDTLKLFPHPFAAHLTVTIRDSLGLSFQVTNPGTAPFTYEVALHTYFSVSDIDAVSVGGLRGCRYVDKPSGGLERLEGNDEVAIAGEVDRVYDSGGPVALMDRGATGGSGSRRMAADRPWCGIRLRPRQPLSPTWRRKSFASSCASRVAPSVRAPSTWRAASNTR